MIAACTLQRDLEDSRPLHSGVVQAIRNYVTAHKSVKPAYGASHWGAAGMHCGSHSHSCASFSVRVLQKGCSHIDTY
jgi:hypothetical protein